MGELSYYVTLIWFLALIFPLWFLKRGDKLGSPEPFEIPIVVLLLCLALGLRVFQLTEHPYELHNDEMSVGIYAREWLKSPRPYLFGSSWAGLPEISYIYSSLGMFVFGDNLFGLRITSSFFSVLGLLGAYLFVRLLFGIRAAVCFLLLAVPFHWSVHLGRTGHHYVQTAFFYPWALWAFLYTFKSKSYLAAGLTGIFTALALHSYFASRLIIVLQFLFFMIIWFQHRDRKTFLLGLTFGAFLFASLLPSLYYFLNNPNEFSDRTNQVVIWSKSVRNHVLHKANSEIWSEILLYQIKRAFGLFHFYGDSSVQYGFYKPFASGILYWPLLISFILGVLFIRKTPWTFIMLPIVMTLFIGGALTIDPPFTPRLAGISALCLAPLAVLLSRVRGKIGLSILAIALAVYISQQVKFYFKDFREYKGESRRDFIVRFLSEHPSIKTVVNLFDEPEDHSYQSYEFLAPKIKFKEGELSVDSESLIVSPKEIDIKAYAKGRSNRKKPLFWYHVK